MNNLMIFNYVIFGNMIEMYYLCIDNMNIGSWSPRAGHYVNVKTSL